MLDRIIPAFLACAIGLFTLAQAPPAQASSPTDEIDGTGLMDLSTGTFNPRGFAHDPYLHISPSYRFEYTSAEISRERPCVANRDQFSDELAGSNPRVVENSDCATPQIVNRRELDYRATRHTMDLTLRTGARGIELRLNAPLVIRSTRGLRYSQAQRSVTDQPVTEGTSFVDPSTERIRRHGEDVFGGGGSFAGNVDRFQTHRFFALSDTYEGSTYERSGFADPSIGIHWSPWSDYRDDTKSTMHIGLDYTLPVARIQEAGNSALGRGVHDLTWSVGASKKFDWIEPYFGAEANLPLARSNSLFGSVDSRGDAGQGQVVDSPPIGGLFSIGTEIIPYEDPDQGARYSFDLRFTFGYTSEGRDYTPLFDHMTDPENHCNNLTLNDVQPQFVEQNGEQVLDNPDDVACAWVVQQPSNSTDQARYDLSETPGTQQFRFTDLMTVDSYGTFGLQLGANLQPHHIFRFHFLGGITHHQAHLLTNARTGSTGGEGAVSMTDSTQRNPAYNPAYDNSGDRFRITRYNTWNIMVGTSLQF